mmetsp:Transcript_34399/g.32796  ORF Transcript_34399/g.32796 Transcript_34399/m.32796 type:complete len:101 (-) Transcript_34399:19-321(-)
MMSNRIFIIVAISLIVESFQYVNLRPYLSISNSLRFKCELSKSMRVTGDLIRIRQAVGSESSESRPSDSAMVMVAQSLVDEIPTPGGYTVCSFFVSITYA